METHFRQPVGAVRPLTTMEFLLLGVEGVLLLQLGDLGLQVDEQLGHRQFRAHVETLQSTESVDSRHDKGKSPQLQLV